MKSTRKVIAKVRNGCKTLLITNSEYCENIWSITICDSEKADKAKVLNCTQFVLPKEKFKKIFKNIWYVRVEGKQYYGDETEDRILRVWYWPIGHRDDNMEWCFEIFDQDRAKWPKAVKESILLSKGMLESLLEQTGISF